MKTIALVYPPYHFNSPFYLQPPLVIAHLYALLENAQVGSIEAIDLDVEFNNSSEKIDYFLNRAIKRVESVEPDVVCLTCKSAQLPFVVLFSREYKSLHPETKIIVGGWMPTLIPDLVLQLSECDVIVRGEGERNLLKLLRRIDDEKWSVDGISYMARDAKHIVHNPNSSVLKQEELDSLPLPRYDVLPPLSRYQPEFKNFLFTVEASRGCTNHRCIFCWNSTKNCNTNWRTRSPNRVVKEIKYLVDNWAANNISFADDNFGADARWLSEFVSLMKAEFDPGEVVYGCSMRIDVVNEQLLEGLYEIGLRIVFHGIESGSPHFWNILGKNFRPQVTREYITRIVRKEVEMGIDSQCSFMIGLPNETEEDIDATMSLCRELVDIGAHFVLHILAPHEGTDLFELYSDIIESYDVYKEFGESENFGIEVHTVFGDRLEEFFHYLPDNRWVRPAMSPDVFRQKFLVLRGITSQGLPFF